MMAGRLQEYIGASGHAQSLLYFGPKTTPQIFAQLEFETFNGIDTYLMRLFHGTGDTLFFAEETLSFLQSGFPTPKTISLGSGHQESKIGEWAEKGEKTAKTFRHLLNFCRVYHFHDTSSTARVRQYCYIGDDRWLMPDAGNLAAILFRLREENNGESYQPIIKTIKLIAPFFDDFDLRPTGPNKKDLILNWKQKGSDQIFGPHQLSDGTIRAICLITLLLQPIADLPELVIVDEPELGLHPFALNIIASLFNKASNHTQILISTQSSTFLDEFNPEDIIVANRIGMETQFTRLQKENLVTWLEDYSLGEVWEKNILGGGPH